MKIRLHYIIIVVLLSIFGSGCSNDADSLTIYSGRSEELLAPLVDKYQTENPKLDIQVRYGGSVELALLLQEEGSKTPADIFISKSPGPVAYLAEEGVLGILPSKILNKSRGSDSENWVAITGRQRVLVFNRDSVSDSDLPSSIFDLVQPNWKGRVGIAPTNGSFQDFFTLFRLEYGDDVALNWLKGMAENEVIVYPKNSAIVQATARGEIDAGLVNHYYNARLKLENPDTPSENHQFAVGDPGAITIATAASVTKSGNKNVAEDFIQYLLGVNAQNYFVDETLEYPVLDGIEPNERIGQSILMEFGSFDALGSGLEQTLELIREAGFDI